MPETTENKVTKNLSLDPDIVAWVTQKAARLTIENKGRVSDSQLVNDILRDAKERDEEEQASKLSPTKIEQKRKRAVSAVSLAA